MCVTVRAASQALGLDACSMFTGRIVTVTVAVAPLLPVVGPLALEGPPKVVLLLIGWTAVYVRETGMGCIGRPTTVTVEAKEGLETAELTEGAEVA